MEFGGCSVLIGKSWGCLSPYVVFIDFFRLNATLRIKDVELTKAKAVDITKTTTEVMRYHIGDLSFLLSRELKGEQTELDLRLLGSGATAYGIKCESTEMTERQTFWNIAYDSVDIIA